MSTLPEIIKARKLGAEIAELLGMSYATYRKRITRVKYYPPIPESELRQAAIAILERDLQALKSNTLLEVLKDVETRGKI